MSDLIAGITSSSIYSSYTGALISNDSTQALIQTSSQTIEQASFSFDAVFLETDRPPIVSVPVGNLDENDDSTMEILTEKLAGFLEPFGKSGDELVDVIESVLGTISNLLQITSEDANAISIDINLIRLEESASVSTGNASVSAVMSGFALEISVGTAEVAYNPDQSGLVKLSGSQIIFGSYEMMKAHDLGILQFETPSIPDDLSLFNNQEQNSDEMKHIVEFLKTTSKQINPFSYPEEELFRNTIIGLLIGSSALSVKV